MQFLSLAPFVPSGKNFEASKSLFQQIGFTISWDAGDYVGFKKDEANFILQKFDDEIFAQNLMINVKITDAAAFRQHVLDKQLPEQYGIRITKVMEQPYGKEVNIIDLAGVCWHFVE